MSSTQVRVVSAGLFFVFIFMSGFWLSHAGRPLNSGILTIHKLISVAAVVWLGVNVYRLHQATALSTPELLAVIVAGLFFLGTIVTGGLLSVGKEMPAAVSTAHKLLPYLTALSTAVMLYLLSRR